MVGLRQAQRGDAEAIEQRAERVMTEGIGIPLGHHYDRLLRPAGLFCLLRGGRLGGGIPAGVDDVVLWIGGSDGRRKAQEFRFLELSCGRLELQFCILCEGFGANVGGEELGVPGLQAEVRGSDVPEEVVGMSNDFLVDGYHALEIVWNRGCAGQWSKVVEPVKTPFEWSYDAIGIAGG